ncbi:MAG: hypothetical protein MHM6MM_002617 [Cercozoa sp. M6MM]
MQGSSEPRPPLSEFADDRVRGDVTAPPRFAPLDEELFPEGAQGRPDLRVLFKQLYAEGRLSHDQAMRLVTAAKRLFRAEPNLLRLSDPITVCGDVHGQFFDLVRLLEAGGDPASTNYLFLGDYVDRGCFSTEVVFYLFAFKICYPETFHMLRGNHECRHLTTYFNFRDECIYKYNYDVYEAIMQAFDYLPLAATVNNKFLCVHGGLSPDVATLDDIDKIERGKEVPKSGAFCDLLWADPVHEPDPTNPMDDDDDYNINADQASPWFSYNETRQCSYVFGADATSAFLRRNRLTCVIRAHEAQYEGYKMAQKTRKGVPRVITIFSAPNYCDAYKNKGACLRIDEDMLNIRQFNWSPHPYYLPNFMSVFEWSLPFVAEKVTDMLVQLVRKRSPRESPREASARTVPVLPTGRSSVIRERGGVLKQKVQSITRMMRIYKMLRQENDVIVRLKQLTPSGRLPVGILHLGKEAMQRSIDTFSAARTADHANEAMPTVEQLEVEGDDHDCKNDR